MTGNEGVLLDVQFNPIQLNMQQHNEGVLLHACPLPRLHIGEQIRTIQPCHSIPACLQTTCLATESHDSQLTLIVGATDRTVVNGIKIPGQFETICLPSMHCFTAR